MKKKISVQVSSDDLDNIVLPFKEQLCWQPLTTHNWTAADCFGLDRTETSEKRKHTADSSPGKRPIQFRKGSRVVEIADKMSRAEKQKCKPVLPTSKALSPM